MILQGKLGFDPEIKLTETGKKVANLNLAVSTGSGDSKKTVWYEIACWGKMAEYAVEHYSKGSEMVVSGWKFRTSEYKSKKTGETVSQPQLTAETFWGALLKDDPPPKANFKPTDEDIPF